MESKWNRWNDCDAARCGSELALRVYTSRLLGTDPALVLHGGGNTSIKLNENGSRMLYVKGTGSDLASVSESSFTSLRLDCATEILARTTLTNVQMTLALNACVAHRPAPRPSIETLLHAGLPFRCVEHTHADAVLAAMNVADIESVHAAVYGDRAPLVPYHHSGHALARACMEVLHARRSPRTIGLILAFHGVVAFGDNCRISYENMIELVERATRYLQDQGAWQIADNKATPAKPDTCKLRELHAEVNAVAGRQLNMQKVSNAQTLAFAQRVDLADISQQGPATPQHAVYTKRVPLLGRNVSVFAADYRAYLDEHLGKQASTLIDAAPRIVIDPAFGMLAFGTNAKSASMAAEMYQHDIAIITRASAHGLYRSAPPSAIALAEFEYGGHAARLKQAINNE